MRLSHQLIDVFGRNAAQLLLSCGLDCPPWHRRGLAVCFIRLLRCVLAMYVSTQMSRFAHQTIGIMGASHSACCVSPSPEGAFRAPRLSRRPLVGHEQERPLRAPGLPPAGKHSHLPLLRHGSSQTVTRTGEQSPRTPLLQPPQGGQPPGTGARVQLQAAARGVYRDPRLGV